MVSGKKIILFCLTLVLATLVFVVFSNSDTKMIKKQLGRLSEYLALEQNEPPLVLLKRSAQAGALFSETVTLKMPQINVDGQFSRKEITDRILFVKKNFSRLRIIFQDINISLSEKTAANIFFTVRIQGTRHGEDYSEVQEIEMTMQKQEKKWLISTAALVEVLEK